MELTEQDAQQLLATMFSAAQHFTIAKKENGRSGLLAVIAPLAQLHANPDMSDTSDSNNYFNSVAGRSPGTTTTTTMTAATTAAAIGSGSVIDTTPSQQQQITSSDTISRATTAYDYLVCVGTKLNHVLLVYNVSTNTFNYDIITNSSSSGSASHSHPDVSEDHENYVGVASHHSLIVSDDQHKLSENELIFQTTDNYYLIHRNILGYQRALAQCSHTHRIALVEYLCPCYDGSNSSGSSNGRTLITEVVDSTEQHIERVPDDLVIAIGESLTQSVFVCLCFCVCLCVCVCQLVAIYV
jgi:hypothetical protein